MQERTMKIVINNCYGGFGLNRKALHRLRELGEETAIDETDIGEQWADGSGVRESYLDSFCSDIPRDSVLLLQVTEEMDASAKFAQLKVIEIPDGTDWKIEEYDGIEWVAEVHETWS